jgi:hypothetical protein
MNVTEIKSAINEVEENGALLRRLKTQVCNSYVTYIADYLVMQEDINTCYGTADEKKALEESYLYMSLETASDAFSDVGLSIKKNKIEYRRSARDYEYCNIFPFKVLWSDIESLTDEDFLVATLSLISNIESCSYLGKFYKGKISRIVKDVGFGNVYDMVLKHDTVFVAMWFDDSMRKVRAKIENAVKVCGYSPVFIDEKEHNNQIVPEIFFEIRESAFVIADLTGQRNGVYYEAGYAEALKKKVILTCDIKEKGKPHFDVAQKNIIFWNSPDDLYRRLCARIVATCPIL